MSAGQVHVPRNLQCTPASAPATRQPVRAPSLAATLRRPLTAPHTTAMNNQQFRRLLVDSPGQPDGNGDSSSKGPAVPSRGAVLGARKSASIPMTPFVQPSLHRLHHVGLTTVQAPGRSRLDPGRLCSPTCRAQCKGKSPQEKIPVGGAKGEQARCRLHGPYQGTHRRRRRRDSAAHQESR